MEEVPWEWQTAVLVEIKSEIIHCVRSVQQIFVRLFSPFFFQNSPVCVYKTFKRGSIVNVIGLIKMSLQAPPSVFSTERVK